ncbi:class I SAM-dependent methyltransferase [Lichenihabitans sp. PAMC28606]|uniref:class I SAM-dependent methyltransferase n=1 Tax=Lichenihabitans sp. PAMC28606 TaxID=2880932 RepID=UPI001D0B74D3|nr:class I SAM-dependent methyltransferase [Lichenihabitans sp. PAMC28606]UDL93068.1 class I SAM-dependent methyltransferase [Lichenihabitans sp. PAMC28606]
MHFALEPEASKAFDFVNLHKPEMIGKILADIPADWWRLALKRGLEYSKLNQQADAFMNYYADRCSGKHFSHDWFTSKAWIWHELLLPYRDNAVDILELGVFEGRSVIFDLEMLPRSRVTAVDHFVLKAGWTSSQNVTLTQDCETTFRQNTAGYGDRVDIRVAPSWIGLTELIREGRQFDICYIDASHTAPDVMADSILAWKLLKVGGLFVWDDFLLDIYHWDEGPVGPGVLNFLKSFPGTFDFVHAGWQVAVRKTAELSLMP